MKYREIETTALNSRNTQKINENESRKSTHVFVDFIFFKMAASDWEEIKRLAADFQRAQLSSTAHKLSERNCIEIVNKLINLGLIDVIYTTDGKEYLTPQELEKEIRDEVIVHGGNFHLFILDYELVIFST